VLSNGGVVLGLCFGYLGLIFAIMWLRLFLGCCVFPCILRSQKLDVVKGFEALNAKNFGIAFSVFNHVRTAYPSIASFGLYKLYFESKEFHSLDSAWCHLHRSMQYFSSDSIRLRTKKIRDFQGIGWTSSALGEHYQELAKLKFDALGQSENLHEIIQFIALNPQFVGRANAERFRDSLWLRYCGNQDMFCLLSLRALSPNSYFKEVLAQALDAKSFEEWVVDTTETELSTFLLYHPHSKFVTPAQDEIFSMYLQSQDTNAYQRFIKEYSTNRNINKIWKAYFHASIGNYEPQKMTVFLALHPDYPFRTQVLQELTWYGKPLFPIINRDDLYGFMNEEGHMVVDFAYEEVNDFHEGLAAVMKNSRYGVIKTNGEVAVEFEYDLISDFQSAHAIVKMGDKFGVIDRNGKSIITPTYQDLQFVFSDVLLCLVDGQYELMNTQGEILSDQKFMEFFPIDENFALVSDGRGKGVLNSSLSLLIPCQFDDVKAFKEGFIVKKEGKVGIIDFLGRRVVPCTYDEISTTIFPFLLVRKEKKFFHLSVKDWRMVTVPSDIFEGWNNISVFNGTNFLIQRKGSIYWVDTIGRLTKANKLPMVVMVGYMLVGNQTLGGNLGIFDRQGVALSGLDFQEVQMMENGFMKTLKNGKNGIFDATGSLLIEHQYDEMVYWPKVKLFLTERDSKQGIIDINGKVLLENKYASIKQYSEQFLSMNFEHQILYFNFKTGKIVKLIE
jgi:hypothetical protein